LPYFFQNIFKKENSGEKKETEDGSKLSKLKGGFRKIKSVILRRGEEEESEEEEEEESEEEEEEET